MTKEEIEAKIKSLEARLAKHRMERPGNHDIPALTVWAQKKELLDLDLEHFRARAVAGWHKVPTKVDPEPVVPKRPSRLLPTCNESRPSAKPEVEAAPVLPPETETLVPETSQAISGAEAAGLVLAEDGPAENQDKVAEEPRSTGGAPKKPRKARPVAGEFEIALENYRQKAERSAAHPHDAILRVQAAVALSRLRREAERSGRTLPGDLPRGDAA